MATKYPTPPGDSMAPIGRALSEVRRGQRELARPSAVQIGELVQQVQTALVNLNAQVAASIAANSYTKSTIDSLIAHPPAGSAVTGNISATGDVTATNVTGTNVFAQSLSTNITAGRVQLWGRTSDGYIATAVSSEKFKSNIRLADLDPDVVLEVGVNYFEYTVELRKRDDPTFEEYVGPWYHVSTNIGVIAERLHELGLWQFVVYERIMVAGPLIPNDLSQDEGDEYLPITYSEQLHLDENGEPIPLAVHDSLFVYALLPVMQRMHRRQNAFATRLAALDGQEEDY